MLTLAVFLAINPHPDLWLDGAAFAAKYCPAELGGLAESWRRLDEARAEVLALPPAERDHAAVHQVLRGHEGVVTAQAERLRRAGGVWRSHLRADPTFRPPSPPGPATSGNP